MSCCRAGARYSMWRAAKAYLMSIVMIVGMGWKEELGRMALLLCCDLKGTFHVYSRLPTHLWRSLGG